ncbi:head GIN domain-containing protein [Cellulophaga lytica]|uniref:head GIN domain-containing protein n=1 Tax=Cellulophaga lytica TaxID=979 RepID=UPI0026E24C00|nr:head GIN domain-containing protein [Cellulophaga lytica]MDO6854966.1 head GIN domain-containing protein [Cellulophaga lytica]
MKINQIKIVTALFLVVMTMSVRAQVSEKKVASFNKVIVSPHVQVTFIEGETESVIIESSTVAEHKINVEVSGKTLRLYLEGAKEFTKSEKTYKNGYKQRTSIYKDTVVKAVITYKNIEELSLRGEETIVCKSLFAQNKLRLKIYGESQVFLNDTDLKELHATIYGESFLELKKGSVENLKITAYGETKINTLGIKNDNTKITAYGEGGYRVQVSKKLKVTAYGEATVAYQGNPELNKGLIIGEATIQKIQ